MLIRINGGSAGIKEYLETGKKQGRAQSRTELDERVVLAGNLELMDAIIRSHASKGDRYLHITLSFREDEVDRATLTKIIGSFESFAFAAYRPDEYAYYAEAHLPRTKSLINKRTGKPEERKPHIHIVIPKVNLLSGKHLEPFGLVRMNKPYINAWQENTNLRHGLASPKEHRRVTLQDRSDILARYKGDLFNGKNKAFKAELLKTVLTTNVRSLKGLAALAGKSGSTRFRNEGSDHEYLNVKLNGEAKGINLREYVFSSAFLALPLDEKREKIASRGFEYVEKGEPGECDSAYEALLSEWDAVRSREVKYVFSGGRKMYNDYKNLPAEGQWELLDDLERRFYESADQSRTVARYTSAERGPEAQLVEGSEDRAETIPLAIESEPPMVPSTVECVPLQLLRDASMERDRAKDEESALLREVRYRLDPRLVLEELVRTKGLLASKYQVVESDGDEQRILCGKRRLNIADFLTKEGHLDWPEAVNILCSLYVRQLRACQDADRSPNEARWLSYAAFAVSEARRMKVMEEGAYLAWRAAVKLERNDYHARKRLVYSTTGKEPADKKAEISLLAMDHLGRLDKMRLSYLAQTRSCNLETGESLLRRFCRDECESGDVMPSATGDKKSNSEDDQLRSENGIMGREGLRVPTPITIEAGLFTHRILKGGDVLYSYTGRQLIRDSGRTIWACDESREAVEACLKLALVKFGFHLRVVGSSAFKKAVVKIAAERNMLVDFGDPYLNDLLLQEKLRFEAVQSSKSKTKPTVVKAVEY